VGEGPHLSSSTHLSPAMGTDRSSILLLALGIRTWARFENVPGLLVADTNGLSGKTFRVAVVALVGPRFVRWAFASEDGVSEHDDIEQDGCELHDDLGGKGMLVVLDRSSEV
jgi:hypothetical protein